MMGEITHPTLAMTSLGRKKRLCRSSALILLCLLEFTYPTHAKGEPSQLDFSCDSKLESTNGFRTLERRGGAKLVAARKRNFRLLIIDELGCTLSFVVAPASLRFIRGQYFWLNATDEITTNPRDLRNVFTYEVTKEFEQTGLAGILEVLARASIESCVAERTNHDDSEVSRCETLEMEHSLSRLTLFVYFFPRDQKIAEVQVIFLDNRIVSFAEVIETDSGLVSVESSWKASLLMHPEELFRKRGD